MSRGMLVALVGVPVIGALVYLGGLGMTTQGRTGLMAGVLIGCAVQLVLLVAGQAAFPAKPLAAYGMGLLVRMIVVVVAALVLLKLFAAPDRAPLLLSLVSVLFATTLLEPIALAAGRRTKS